MFLRSVEHENCKDFTELCKTLFEKASPEEIIEKLDAMVLCYVQHAEVSRLDLANTLNTTHYIMNYFRSIQILAERKEIILTFEKDKKTSDSCTPN